MDAEEAKEITEIAIICKVIETIANEGEYQLRINPSHLFMSIDTLTERMISKGYEVTPKSSNQEMVRISWFQDCSK